MASTNYHHFGAATDTLSSVQFAEYLYIAFLILKTTMPTDFDKKEYWHQRFAKENSFEWLVPSEVFISILEPYLRNLDPSSKILQLGFGTSDLQNHIRARGFRDVLNVDYEPLAIERGQQLEKQAFGDVHMRYMVADVTQLGSAEGHDLVLDKSTVDAVSCGGDEALCRMAHGVKRNLSPKGFWISLSYSSSRFDIYGLPFDVEVIARIPTPKSRETDPDIFHHCYLLRPKAS